MVSQVEVVSGIPGSDHDAIQFSVKSTKPSWLGIIVSPMTLKRLTLIDSETFSVRSPGTAAS